MQLETYFERYPHLRTLLLEIVANAVRAQNDNAADDDDDQEDDS